MSRRRLTDEDRAFIRAEYRAAGMDPIPSAEERHAEEVRLMKKMSRNRGGHVPPPVHSLTARKCRCEVPQTYVDLDGERRCTCGCPA